MARSSITGTIYHFDISKQYIPTARGDPPPSGRIRWVRPQRESNRSRRGYPWRVSSRPGALEGVQTSPSGGRVEYLLARNAVVREYRKGRLADRRL